MRPGISRGTCGAASWLDASGTTDIWSRLAISLPHLRTPDPATAGTALVAASIHVAQVAFEALGKFRSFDRLPFALKYRARPHIDFLAPNEFRRAVHIVRTGVSQHGRTWQGSVDAHGNPIRESRYVKQVILLASRTEHIGKGDSSLRRAVLSARDRSSTRQVQ